MQLTNGYPGMAGPSRLKTQAQAADDLQAAPPKAHAYEAIHFGLFWDREHQNKLKLMLDAVAKNDRERVQQLINEGVKINRPLNGVTPLLQAAYFHHADMAAFLMDKGADPNQPDLWGRSPVMALLADLTLNDNPEQFRMIGVLAPRTDLTRVDHHGNTAILLAVKNGYDEVVDALIAAGADVSWQNPRDKMTTLMYAAWRGRLFTAEKLVAAVPPDKLRRFVNLRNRFKRSALDFARDNEHLDIAILLYKKGAMDKPAKSKKPLKSH